MINIKTAGRNGPVVSVNLCRNGDDVMFITESGMIVRSGIDSLSPMGRATQGVKLVNLKSDDQLVSVDVISERDLEKFAEKEGSEEQEGDAPTSAGAPAAEGAPAPEDSAEQEDSEEGDADGDAADEPKE